MTQTTPTRDEAPDVLAKQITAAASDMCEIARIAGEWRNGPKQSLTAIREIRAVLASAPAPASGGVDAGRVTLFSALEAAYIRGAAWCAEMGMTHTFAELRKAAYDYADKEEKDVICREVSASLSPAATPVSEAEPVAAVVAEELALKIVSLSVNWLREDGTDREHDDYVRANWTKEIAEAKRLILAALAKPAPSPAPVRPIGNQGISDYQREIARNMAEGFAAWNAARQEALPSDEPASSPAGWDVREALKALMRAVQRAEDGAGTISAKEAVKLRPADWHAVCDRARALAALSPSTSAGRGDGDAGS